MNKRVCQESPSPNFSERILEIRKGRQAMIFLAILLKVRAQCACYAIVPARIYPVDQKWHRTHWAWRRHAGRSAFPQELRLHTSEGDNKENNRCKLQLCCMTQAWDFRELVSRSHAMLKYLEISPPFRYHRLLREFLFLLFRNRCPCMLGKLHVVCGKKKYILRSCAMLLHPYRFVKAECLSPYLRAVDDTKVNNQPNTFKSRKFLLLVWMLRMIGYILCGGSKLVTRTKRGPNQHWIQFLDCAVCK